MSRKTTRSDSLRSARQEPKTGLPLRTEIVRALMAVDAGLVLDFCRIICRAISQGRTIYTFGNGGSAAIASHIAVDLTQICQGYAGRTVGAIRSLGSDMSILTGLANDYGYNSVFLRQLRGVVMKDDIVLGISSSGRSPNVLRAASLARKRGAVVLGLTGRSGGKFGKLCDRCFVTDSNDKYAIEAVHVCFAHLVAVSVRERLLRARGNSGRSRPQKDSSTGIARGR